MSNSDRGSTPRFARSGGMNIARSTPSGDASGIVPRRLSAAVALGNALEVFDFTIFSFFSVYIAAAFFPARDALTSLLLTVATFGVGFLFRPLGALVIGAYADRRGRRAALTATIWLMAAGTAAIAVCPPFATIGLWAPVVLVLARLLQGFSAGGEIGPATAFLMESGPIERRGFNVSWQLGGQGAANLVGSASGLILTQLLSKAELAAWGLAHTLRDWRPYCACWLSVAPSAARSFCKRGAHFPRPGSATSLANHPVRHSYCNGEHGDDLRHDLLHAQLLDSHRGPARLYRLRVLDGRVGHHSDPCAPVRVLVEAWLAIPDDRRCNLWRGGSFGIAGVLDAHACGHRVGGHRRDLLGSRRS